MYLEGLSSPEVEKRVPRMAASILNLAVERLRLLGRALQGHCDAGELMAPFNSEGDSPRLREDVGFVLVPGAPSRRPGVAPRHKRGRSRK